ncbi:MAG TPA: hypothetical protein VL294_13315 [Pseudolysinimonas sp.]|nr:hypothetical protein [Pseudolysinimonas sp.]
MKTLTRQPRRKRAEPTDALTCRSCGDEVKRPDPSRDESVIIRAEMPLGMSLTSDRPVPFGEEKVTRCDECADRRARAAELLAAHPRVRRAHGSVALDRLDAALAALDLGGFRGRKVPASLTNTDAALLDLIDALAPVGAAATWSVTRTASGARWGHVSSERAADARTAIRDLVARRAEVPMPFAPPGSLADGTQVLGGCLLCGRESLTVKPSEAAAAWGDLVRVNVAGIGGRTRPEPVTGYICPKCRESVAKVGVPGLPAIQRAVLAHFGYELRRGYDLNMTTLRGWAALPVGTEPNRAPWQHLDLDKLARKFKRWESEAYLRRLDA